MTLRKLALPLLLPITLAACSDDDNGPDIAFKDVAVVATRAADYSSGAVSLVDQKAPFTALNAQSPTTSDLAVRSGGDHYFLIERGANSLIKRFDPADPNEPVYAYSTNDADEISNPYDILVASPTKAYVLRYDSGKVWIVNPSAATEAQFKTGEIDLSAYDADGVPEMSAGLIQDGKLYIALQRLENFAAVKPGYIAVIDIATDQEIDTGDAGAALKGIELPIRNPESLVADPAGNRIFVSSNGGFDNFVPTYEGGIIALDPADYSTTILLDDGTAEDNAYGQIVAFAAITGERGYFIGSTGWGDDQTLYRYELDVDGEVVAVDGLQDVGLANDLAVDAEGQLWLGRTEFDAPGLTVVGFANGTETVVAPLIDTVLTPQGIAFVTVEEAPAP